MQKNWGKLGLTIIIFSITVMGYGGLCTTKSSNNDTSSGSSIPITSTNPITSTLPAKVTLISPANDATNVITTTQLSWSSAISATSYAVYFGISTAGWSPITNTINTTYNPNTLLYNTKYYWQIDSKNESGTTPGDIWNFRTVSEPIIPSLRVITPNGGENWTIWNYHTIIWSTTGTIEQIKIEYSIDNFNTITTIQNSFTNHGSYDAWIIPNDPSTTVKIRILDKNNPLISDISDANFTISQPSPNSWSKIEGSYVNSRRGPSSVWTGTVMFTFGGKPDYLTNPLNDIWTYYPTTNGRITLTPTGGPPPRRYEHSSVWTGSEMIVFGGDDGSYGLLNDLWKYNPITNTWIQLTPSGDIPLPRYAHSAVWTGSDMLVFGGYGGGYIYELWKYNPATNTWTKLTPTGGPPTPRYEHSVIWTGSEMIIFGGSNGTNLNDLWKYNPITNSWTEIIPVGDSPSARYGHSAVWTGSDIIIFGGTNSNSLNDIWKYNLGMNTWTQITPTGTAPSIRYTHSAIWTGFNMLILDGRNNFSDYFDDLWRYTPE